MPTPVSCYGTNIVNQFRQLGIYTGRLLKGEKPADLLVQQAMKLDLIINLETARALGIDVPMSMLMSKKHIAVRGPEPEAVIMAREDRTLAACYRSFTRQPSYGRGTCQSQSDAEN
jgi:hypothetical protein